VLRFGDGITQIDDGLFQGGVLDVQREWANLKEHVDVVLVLTNEFGDHGLLPDDGPQIIYFGIPDCATGLDQHVFDELRARCAALADKRVLTVCFMGENRSGLASALVLMARGKAPADAAKLVHERGPHRSVSQPHSFWNPGFNRQVAECR
jgi:protein-tyrosine phosphatase